MNQISADTTADLFFQVNWSSDGVQHTDAYSGHQVNFWRDMLPYSLNDLLMGKQTGDQVSLAMPAIALVGTESTEDIQTVGRRQFDGSLIKQNPPQPRLGRFYPKGILAGMPGIFKANKEPFRCISQNNGHLGIDLGHPLAGKSLELLVTVGAIRPKPEERGGGVRDWGELITLGLGMQARWNGQATDFFTDRPFHRLNTSPDSDFYARTRLVQHIDDTAIDIVRQTYARFLTDDMMVLDLMSSWQSHLPQDVHLQHVTGLGLNEVELQNNNRLNDHVVHDLNADAKLPFDDQAFDVILCTVSVEYLIDPFTVFEEAARVLKPGGYFVISFSNRWFDPKVTRIWTELHEFERMGLVLEYFRGSGRFDDLQTYSVRGLKRPFNDKYYGKIPFSDPVFAVWGRRI